MRDYDATKTELKMYFVVVYKDVAPTALLSDSVRERVSKAGGAAAPPYQIGCLSGAHGLSRHSSATAEVTRPTSGGMNRKERGEEELFCRTFSQGSSVRAGRATSQPWAD
jgi:hypothetical protein